MCINLLYKYTLFWYLCIGPRRFKEVRVPPQRGQAPCGSNSHLLNFAGNECRGLGFRSGRAEGYSPKALAKDEGLLRDFP